MKKTFILLFFIVFTEGVIFSQNPPTDFDDEAARDSITDIYDIPPAYNNEATADEDPARPFLSPYAASQKKYLSEPIEQRDFEKKTWLKATEGMNFSKDMIEKPTPTQNNTDYSWIAALIPLLKWFFIIGGVLLLAFLIYKFIGEGNVFSGKNRKLGATSTQIDLDNIEENLETAELDPFILKAIAAKNYPLAIRLYYLAILKELTLTGAIVWKKDKTNRIYLKEMQSHALFTDFRSVTTIFERVWYGSSTLEEAGFLSIQTDFKDLLTATRKQV